jgi:glycosyltransferase involved in cell wall biosynthesis
VIRVLHLVASSRGGGATHVHDLARRLDRSRFSVEVAMPEDGGTVTREDFEAAGIPFHAVSIASGFSLRALRQLHHLAAQVDILHVQGARGALFGRLAAAALGTRRPRIVYSIHGFTAPYYPQPRRFALLSLERALAAFTDVYIGVSHAEREALVAAGVARPQRARAVQNGIDTRRFRVTGVDREAQREALRIPPGALLLTTVCRLDKPRDLDTVLAALRALVTEYPSLHLLIVGDGPLRPHVEQQLQRLSLTPHMTLTGWRQDLPLIYAASDIYTLTTWGWEGLPLTVLEAMAAGLPVVATNAGGTPEAVVDGETGFLVGRRDVSGLAEALKKLAADSALRRRMGRAGQARAERAFTLERMVRDIQQVYESLLRQYP